MAALVTSKCVGKSTLVDEKMTIFLSWIDSAISQISHRHYGMNLWVFSFTPTKSRETSHNLTVGDKNGEWKEYFLGSQGN